MFNMKNWLQNPPSEIVKIPNEILTTPTKPVEDISLIPDIAKIMFQLMYKFHGVGLAAPQVGLPYRFFVCNNNPSNKSKEKIFINPEITFEGDRTRLMEESCLSIPNKSVVVERPNKVTFSYITIEGKQEKVTYEGLMSRIVQHEIDHLDGKLIIMR